MRSKLSLVLAAALAAAAFLPVASATTAPTLTIKIRVIMTDTGVKLSQAKSYRGWNANFIVVNRGKKAHRFEIGGMTTPVLAPGKSRVLGVSLALRGTVTYSDLVNPGGHSTGTFTVI